ncbi:hypothetical protein ACLBXM_19885 [Xanthobacteraceae bacterium A53D]
MLDLRDLANYDTPVFPVSVAAAASVIEAGTMRIWFQRERIKLFDGSAKFEPAVQPEKRGLPRLLTFRAVLTLAAGAPLIKSGVDVADAYEAAKAWTDWADDLNGQEEYSRNPAGLFGSPTFTVLVYRGPHHVTEVVPYNPETQSPPLKFHTLFGVGSPVRVAPTLVLLDSVMSHATSICQGFLK